MTGDFKRFPYLCHFFLDKSVAFSISAPNFSIAYLTYSEALWGQPCSQTLKSASYLASLMLPYTVLYKSKAGLFGALMIHFNLIMVWVDNNKCSYISFLFAISAVFLQLCLFLQMYIYDILQKLPGGFKQYQLQWGWKLLWNCERRYIDIFCSFKCLALFELYLNLWLHLYFVLFLGSGLSGSMKCLGF